MKPLKFAWETCKMIDKATEPLERIDTWRNIVAGLGGLMVAGAVADKIHGHILSKRAEHAEAEFNQLQQQTLEESSQEQQ